MQVQTFNCPNCGASLTVPENTDRFFCTYCGSQMHFDNGRISFDININQNVNINQQYTNVARMRELDLQEQERRRQLQEEERIRKEPMRWWRFLIISSVICVFVLFGSLIIGKAFQSGLLMTVGCIIVVFYVIILPFIMAAIAPHKWVEKNGCLVRIGLFFFVLFFAYTILCIAGFILKPFVQQLGLL